MAVEERHIARAAHPVMIGGKEYHARALTDEYIEDLNEWLRSEVIRIARAANKSLPRREYEKEMSIVYTAVLDLNWREGRGADMMGRPGGFTRIVWMMLKDDHPELDHKQVYDMMRNDEDAILSAVDAFNRLNKVKLRTDGDDAASGGKKDQQGQ